MTNKILVALDGSDGGKRALAAAASHAKLTQADLILSYVIDWTPYSFHTPEELARRFDHFTGLRVLLEVAPFQHRQAVGAELGIH